MTVQEIMEKITKIDDSINIVEGRIDQYGRQDPWQEPLYQVIDRLKEYRHLLLSTNVDILTTKEKT